MTFLLDRNLNEPLPRQEAQETFKIKLNMFIHRVYTNPENTNTQINVYDIKSIKKKENTNKNSKQKIQLVQIKKISKHKENVLTKEKSISLLFTLYFHFLHNITFL